MFSGKVIQISHSIFQQAIDNQTLRCKFYFGLEFGKDLEYILNRLRANKLTLNMTKTDFILIGSWQRLSTLAVSPTITIYDNQVSQVIIAKSLGVTIDNKLDWSSHIAKPTKKVASGIGAIKRIRHLVPRATLVLIYQALIQPHFDYCDIVWGNCGITLQNKAQKLQNSQSSPCFDLLQLWRRCWSIVWAPEMEKT